MKTLRARKTDFRDALPNFDDATPAFLKRKQPFGRCIQLSSRLSKLPMLGREQPRDVIRMIPSEIIPTLQAAKVDFVLVGAHGISGWLIQPRATQDVDFMIRFKDRRAAADAIMAKFPELRIDKQPVVWRFFSNEQPLIDLIFASTALFKRVMKEFETIRMYKLEVKVPKVECALALKFAAMTGHYRKLNRKYQDAADFASIVVKNAELDAALLHELGELNYSGGGAELSKYVADARAGRKLEI